MRYLIGTVALLVGLSLGSTVFAYGYHNPYSCNNQYGYNARTGPYINSYRNGPYINSYNRNLPSHYYYNPVPVYYHPAYVAPTYPQQRRGGYYYVPAPVEKPITIINPYVTQ